METSLSGLINLVPDLTEELLQRVDQPLKVQKDGSNKKYYILCDYNRDGDSVKKKKTNKQTTTTTTHTNDNNCAYNRFKKIN